MATPDAAGQTLLTDAAARMRTRLTPYFDEFGLGPVPEPKDAIPPFDNERLDLVLELRPRVVSFHFGLPDATAVQRSSIARFAVQAGQGLLIYGLL